MKAKEVYKKLYGKHPNIAVFDICPDKLHIGVAFCKKRISYDTICIDCWDQEVNNAVYNWLNNIEGIKDKLNG